MADVDYRLADAHRFPAPIDDIHAAIDTLRAREIRPSVAIIGEPTMMCVIEGHKGCCEYTTRFAGLEGHQPDFSK